MPIDLIVYKRDSLAITHAAVSPEATAFQATQSDEWSAGVSTSVS